MLFSKFTSAALATLFATYAAADDLPAIEVLGSKFFFSNNGSQFYMRGIAYQADTANVTGGATINDPLADYESCKRDIPYLQQLKTNVIRVYSVNTSLDHTKCMQALNDANIYVIADLSAPAESIDRSNPTWTVELFNRYKSVVDMFSNNTNVLGFFAGNEVTNDDTNTDASAFVKAAVRDTKKYIKEQGYRAIPVGYSSNDDANTRVDIADYFTCGNKDDRADFYGINMYEWCGSSTFVKSGYADRTKEFANITVPVFFSEYGCNEVTPRKFTEVQALYGSNMTDVWSGGIVYMYFQETNNYGLVSIEKNDAVSTLPDFSYYSQEINSISPSSVNSASYTPSSSTLSCPATNVYWKAVTSLPPTPNSDLCSCMDAANTCVVADDVDEKDYKTLFNYICGEINCDGISGNGTTGKYGAYSFCSSKQQLNFLLNLYYNKQGGSDSDCNFSGSASIQDATTQSGCSSALSVVGSSGATIFTDDVTYSSGSTTNSGSSSKSSKSSKSSSTSTKNAAAGSFTAVRVNYSQVILSSVLTVGLAAGLGFALV